MPKAKIRISVFTVLGDTHIMKEFNEVYSTWLYRKLVVSQTLIPTAILRRSVAGCNSSVRIESNSGAHVRHFIPLT